MTDCAIELVSLVLLSLALAISLCLNVVFYIRPHAVLCGDDCCDTHTNAESPSPDERHYSHDLNHHELQENPHNHHEQEENPIYGNISTDRGVSVEVCYEMMTMQRTRDHMRPLEPDLNYASLDLKVAKKHKKKHRPQQGHAQGRNMPQDQLPAHLTAPLDAFLDLEADVDAQLPPRDTSTMVSHSSIYLNSQQIAQGAEDLERERGINMGRENMGWEGIRRGEEGGSRGKDESEERKENYSNGSVCMKGSEGEAIQSCILDSAL